MKKTYFRIMMLGLCIGTCGCKLKRMELENVSWEAQSEVENLEAELLSVRSGQIADLDRDAITEAFLQCNFEEASQYEVKSFYELEKRIAQKYGIVRDGELFEDGNRTLSLNIIGDTGGAMIEYNENGTAEFYQYDVNGYLNEGLGTAMGKIFPSTDLEGSTRDGAIAACKKYAEACGYADADVSVFAMSADALNQYMKDYSFTIGAPDPNYQAETKEAYYQMLLRRFDAEEAEDFETVEKIDQERIKDRQVQFIAWEKKDEAYLLVYRPKINGLPIDAALQSLQIVYLPETDRVVHLKAYVPFVLKSAERKTIIPKEQAISAAMLDLGIENTDEFEIQKVELVYSYRATQIQGDQVEIEPCWKIDYQIPSMHYRDTGSIRINAVDGIVSQFVNPM